MQISGFAAELVTQKLLSKYAINQALEQAQAAQVSLINYLLQHELVDYQVFAAAIAQYFHMELYELDEIDSVTLPLARLNKKLIAEHKILPIAESEQELQLLVADPTQIAAFNEIKFQTDLELKLFIAPYDKLSDIIASLVSEQQYSLAQSEDAPVIKFIDQVLHDAIRQGASDIHFEPYENDYRIRFRIDGILHEITRPDYSLVKRITARLKIMANLDIAERRLPQDGRFSVAVTKQQARDCRINTCPTLFGEKVVVRILNPQNAALQLSELGLEEQQSQVINSMIQRPQGLILVTGPTGSGKTMSLYAALNELNCSGKNISTAEDPVEISLLGINQVQINSRIKLDFATSLRAFLRQDPDIIMVGEIRDLETAEIAVKAAQTGHLVLSTLHTNSAAETIIRLLNMGVAPFNINSSVALVIAQRLVRKLCPHCKKRADFATEEESQLESFQAVGCDRCSKGYKGRLGVFEVMPISPKLSQIILQQQNAAAIEAQARAEGVISLRQAALNKVRAGITSLEEINRII